MTTLSGPIVICGAGLAGSACAIRLALWGYPVLLLDKATFPRRKLCGEFLGPDAMPALQSLGVLEQVKARSANPIETMHLYHRSGKALTVKAAWIRRDYPYALALPRLVLDSILVEHAQDLGVEFQDDCNVLSCLSENEDRFMLEFETGSTSVQSKASRQQTISTHWIVDASGRNSRLAALSRRTKHHPTEKSSDAVGFSLVNQRQHSQLAIEKQVGIQCHVQLASQDTDLRMFFFRHGYGGLQPLTEDQANVCLWIQPEYARACRENWESCYSLLSDNPVAKDRLRSATPIEAIQTVAGLPQLHQSARVKPYISVGDAMMTVEPFSGFGMSHALHSGILAAQVIHESIKAGHHYADCLHIYTARHKARFNAHMGVLRLVHPLMGSETLQNCLWPILSPWLPLLARLYR
jgi:flavin-dependent dehydrogenase